MTPLDDMARPFMLSLFAILSLLYAANWALEWYARRLRRQIDEAKRRRAK